MGRFGESEEPDEPTSEEPDEPTSEVEPPVSEEPDLPTSEEPSKKKGGCGGTISGMAIVASVATVLGVLAKKREE